MNVVWLGQEGYGGRERDKKWLEHGFQNCENSFLFFLVLTFLFTCEKNGTIWMMLQHERGIIGKKMGDDMTTTENQRKNGTSESVKCSELRLRFCSVVSVHCKSVVARSGVPTRYTFATLQAVFLNENISSWVGAGGSHIKIPLQIATCRQLVEASLLTTIEYIVYNLACCVSIVQLRQLKKYVSENPASFGA